MLMLLFRRGVTFHKNIRKVKEEEECWCYCLEGESPSIKTSGNIPSDVSSHSGVSFFCLFALEESRDSFFENMSNVVCLWRLFRIFLKWSITLSLNRLLNRFLIKLTKTSTKIAQSFSKFVWMMLNVWKLPLQKMEYSSFL